MAAVALTGPFTGVKEQVVGSYARRIAEAGLVTLAWSASPYWRNEVTGGSLHSLLTFDALGAADLLGSTPLLVVHGRAMPTARRNSRANCTSAHQE